MIAVNVFYNLLHKRDGEKVPARMYFQAETFDDATTMINKLLDSFDDVGYEIISAQIGKSIEEVAKNES